MSAIYTLTLNPALDNSTSTQRIYPDGKLRCDRPNYEPGGGGINVSRAIKKLGGTSTAVFPSGGPSGQHLEELLAKENVKTLTIQIKDWTRENLNVSETETGQQYRFIMPGATMSRPEQEKVLELIDRVEEGSFFVISGSLPIDVPPTYAVEILKKAKSKGVKCILDCSGEPLNAAFDEGGIFLSKPNKNEISQFTGEEINDPDQLEKTAQQLVDEGKAEVLLVSLGPQGALLVTKDFTEYIVPPAVDKNSTVGAGDSLLGAVVLKLSQGVDIREAARYGVAAGTAATMNFGTELCKLEDTENLYDWIVRQQPL